MHRKDYLPEGRGPTLPEGQSLGQLQQIVREQSIWEGRVFRCDSRGNLSLRLGGYEGIIPRQEAVHPSVSGSDREIAILSRVGKQCAVTVTAVETDAGGRPHLTLSRRNAQEKALSWLLENAVPGTVLSARVTHLADFGAFVDLGCGIISLIPLENLSFARVSHPAQRLAEGQDILVTLLSSDPVRGRFYLSHRELLGTWLENAAAFSPGDTVTGTVRNVRSYGIFVELTPNLTGLADSFEGVSTGDRVSVYVRSIRPEVKKIKLQIVQRLPASDDLPPIRYRITDDLPAHWQY